MVTSKCITLVAPPLWMISLVSGLGLFTAAIHMPSVPTMAADFGTTVQLIQLTVAAYLAAMAISALVVGPVSDRFGRRKIGLAMLFIFFLGCVGTLFSDNVATLLVSRIIQGIGASGGLVLSRSMVRDAYVGRAAAKASAQVAMVVSVAPMLGPLVGGYIHDSFGWRANFILVTGVVLILLILAILRFTETLPQVKRYTGDGWSMLTNYYLLMRLRIFLVYALPVIFGSVGLLTFQTEGPVLLMQLMEVSPADYGVFAAMPAIGFLMGTFISSRLALHVNEGTLIEAGCALFVIAGIAVIVFALSFAPSPWLVCLPMMLFGLGNGLVTPSATIGGLSAAPFLVGSAAALISCLRMGAGSLGSVAISGFPSDSAASLGVVTLMAGLSALLSWRYLGRPSVTEPLGAVGPSQPERR
jgi:MFS transporter, DHA1 family, multidrug resistance protein